MARPHIFGILWKCGNEEIICSKQQENNLRSNLGKNCGFGGQFCYVKL